MIAQDDMQNNETETQANDGIETDADANSAGKKAIKKNNSTDKPESIIRKNEDDDSSKVPLWLITFTDVMALMLTFFVLLYSMSSPQKEKWEQMSKGLTQKLNAFNTARFRSGTQDVISLDKISTSHALNVGYVKVVLGRLLKQKNINDVMLIENQNRLVLSLPSDLLFQSGQTKISDKGRQSLFALGSVLSRVKNRIEIVGHSDPRPITGQSKAGYKTNWQLSLARAAEVARILKDVGYNKEITVRGLSSARYDELPQQIPQEERYALSRRVDIIIMNDSGYRLNAFDM